MLLLLFIFLSFIYEIRRERVDMVYFVHSSSSFFFVHFWMTSHIGFFPFHPKIVSLRFERERERERDEQQGGR